MVDLIGITGQKGSGKDEVARILVQEYGFVRVALADALKSVARVIGWDGSKEDLGPCPCCGMLRGRALLQVLGTEGVREHVGEDAWILAAWPVVQTQRRVVIPDIRFPNEAEWIWNNLGEVWRIIRPGYNGDGHSSEMAQMAINPDRIIFNSGSLERLAMKVTAASPVED